MKYSTLGWIAAGLFVSNYVWQFFTNQQWSVAFERSYFQLFAMLCVIVSKACDDIMS